MDGADKNTIVVGVDETDASAAAVAWCTELGRLMSADVIAVHAIAMDSPMPSDEALSRWVQPMVDAGLNVRRVVEDGSPGPLLRQVAGARGASMIVVGSTRRSEVGGLILDSVVEDLAYHSDLPVAIIPPAAARAE